MERLLEPLGQALQRELAVAGLGARVLGDGGHARAELGTYPRFLFVVQGFRRSDVKYGFYPRCRDVRVLTPGT